MTASMPGTACVTPLRAEIGSTTSQLPSRNNAAARRMPAPVQSAAVTATGSSAIAKNRHSHSQRQACPLSSNSSCGQNVATAARHSPATPTANAPMATAPHRRCLRTGDGCRQRRQDLHRHCSSQGVPRRSSKQVWAAAAQQLDPGRIGRRLARSVAGRSPRPPRRRASAMAPQATRAPHRCRISSTADAAGPREMPSGDAPSSAIRRARPLGRRRPCRYRRNRQQR